MVFAAMLFFIVYIVSPKLFICYRQEEMGIPIKKWPPSQNIIYQ